MTGPDWFGALDATWPAAAVQEMGPWRIRTGMGGGNRVSAATAMAEVSEGEIALAESAMAALDQAPIFRVGEGEDELDRLLATRGYVVHDQSVLMAAPVAQVSAGEAAGHCGTLEVWEPLAIQIEMWKAAGIGPGRLAVMDRAAGPKTSLIGRCGDYPGGTAFVALAHGIAMMHALEVPPDARRRGMGRAMTIGAAQWAVRNGADHLALAVRARNEAAVALYTSCGLSVVGRYHYRVKPEGGQT